jgi:hypothetical protein
LRWRRTIILTFFEDIVNAQDGQAPLNLKSSARRNEVWHRQRGLTGLAVKIAGIGQLFKLQAMFST